MPTILSASRTLLYIETRVTCTACTRPAAGDVRQFRGRRIDVDIQLECDSFWITLPSKFYNHTTPQSDPLIIIRPSSRKPTCLGTLTVLGWLYVALSTMASVSYSSTPFERFPMSNVVPMGEIALVPLKNKTKQNNIYQLTARCHRYHFQTFCF